MRALARNPDTRLEINTSQISSYNLDLVINSSFCSKFPLSISSFVYNNTRTACCARSHPSRCDLNQEYGEPYETENSHQPRLFAYQVRESKYNDSEREEKRGLLEEVKIAFELDHL